MDNEIRFRRPTFENAVLAWQNVLKERGLPTQCVWVFDENLCFEKDPTRPGGFRFGFQTAFTPPPQDGERIGYEYFVDFNMPLVFYRLGTCRNSSVCVMLCDKWFETNAKGEGYLRRDEWQILFRPGAAEEVEEITDRARWQGRILRDRPLHELDFAMNLRAVHEILAHGRVLSSYEHYALRFLHAWRRFLK